MDMLRQATTITPGEMKGDAASTSGGWLFR